MISWWLSKRHHLNSSINSFFEQIVQNVSTFFFEAGRTVLFFSESIKLLFSKPSRFKDLLIHMEFVGNQSVLIILLTGAFTGLALSYQIYIGFNLVNATNLVGPTVALGIFKELAPVLTGLIVAARAGGAMAAQLGTMRVSEQIDALEVMGVNPLQYLVAPRLMAAILTMPLLCGVFDAVAIYSAQLLCVNVLGLDSAIFWDKIQMWTDTDAINEGLIKAGIFGMTFSAICTKTGFYTKGGAKGVGDATNKGVVYSMVMIIVLNFFTSNLIRLYHSIMESI